MKGARAKGLFQVRVTNMDLNRSVSIVTSFLLKPPTSKVGCSKE